MPAKNENEFYQSSCQSHLIKKSFLMFSGGIEKQHRAVVG